MERAMKRELPSALGPWAARYGVAIGSVVISVFLGESLVLQTLGIQFPFLMLYPAVICAAWYGGFGPGLLATVLAALAVAFFRFQPRFSFEIAEPAQRIATAIFFALGGGISWLGESLLRANRRLQENAREISQQRDLSEQRAEADIRLLTKLIDQAHDAILIRQPGGSISYWNRGAERIYGWPKEQAMGRVAQELLETRFPKPLTEIEAEVKREKSWEGELVHTRSDGEPVVVASRWAADRDGKGEVKAILEINSDITARKLAEESLQRANQELARSNRELEQFAYVASHDLQEPLRMIASYLELLGERYKGRLDEKADKYINYAIDGATRMKFLINDLLGYSHVTTKTRPPETIDVGAALDEATSNLGKAIAEKQAVVTQDALPTVIVDRTHLIQVFQNLISNALKFCDGTPRIHVSAERQGQGWVFSVRDNGIGIAPEHRERIFQIFQRLHGRDKYSGTGIGLAICKKIVEQYGGRIWVESQPGEGSTFFFTLPVVG
jgi:chemotaxis family two-component system sensor kinase Cph1